MTSDRHATPVDPAHLREQYDDAERLRIRIDTHDRFSERDGTFADWALAKIAAGPSMRLLDVGCGPGPYHPALIAAGAAIVALDQSAGMAREVLAQASRLGATVDVARGDAVALPFADASFDRVIACHMMYHVTDQRGAFEEMRRVLAASGRVVLTTNAGSIGGWEELHERAAHALGYEPLPRDDARFTLDDLDLVRGVFPSAEVFVRDDAFLFREAEPAVRYYASGIDDRIRDRPSDGSHHTPLIDAVRREIERIIVRDGVLRIEKSAGCFVAGV